MARTRSRGKIRGPRQYPRRAGRDTLEPKRISEGTQRMSLAIETHRLTRFFGDFCAVDGIELRVERGTFYGFLGPNGAGKSTTIKMLTGLLAPSEGEILVLGRNMLDPGESLDAKKHMGVIPEDLAL